MAAKKNANPGFNLFLILVVIALFIVSLYFIYSSRNQPEVKPVVIFGKSQTQQKADLMAALKAKYDSKTIEYYDQDYGFKVRYPIGYDAVKEPFPGFTVRFVTYYPPFSVEIYDVRVVNDTELSENVIYSEMKKVDVAVSKETINGRMAYLSNTQDINPANENQTIYLKQAFYDCKTTAGKPYWISFTAALTEELSPDLELAEYMIRTLEC
ncbi:MAG: hypothetical protein V1835_03075 [Candidatus Micrarchaeota archaeon]